MVSKKWADSTKEIITKEWEKSAYHNEEIGFQQIAREMELIEQGYKVNIAGKMYAKIAGLLFSRGEIRGNEVRLKKKAETKEEILNWLQRLKGMEIIKWMLDEYDFGLAGIEIEKNGKGRKTTFFFATRDEDEGYYGGAQTVEYEEERLKEEWKIEKIRMEKEKKNI